MRQYFLPFVLVIILLGLFIPLPSALLDYLIIANFLIGIVLLIKVLLIKQPVALSTLPSLLLILTLLRLVTNISTTRQILSGSEPGKIIPIVGEIVIQNNLMIGLVIFLILTIVQLFVIGKGAERVAEVSARFTLDALPGKQMSIDADVRGGLIDFSEASQKRQDLQLESRFYGALDGAMKFIKGDALVGLLITGINLLGGFTVGVLSQGLSFSQAVQHYSMMTIGDGVISQIPSVLNSIAAGIVVTRVVSLRSENLATGLLEQIFSHAGVRNLIILLCLIFVCLPGMPRLPFLLIVFGLFFWGLCKQALSNKKISQPEPPQILPPALYELFVSPNAQQNIGITLSWQLQAKIYSQTGLYLIPPVISDQSSEHGYLLKIRGVTVASGIVPTDLQSEDLIIFFVEVIKNFAIDLVDDRCTKALFEIWEKTAPYQSHYLIPEKITITRVTNLIKELLQEKIFPKNFDLIVQVIVENIERNPSNLELLSLLRQAYRYQITACFAPNQELRVISLDPMIEQHFFQAISNNQTFQMQCLQAILNGIKEYPEEISKIILICSANIRRFIWDCLRASNLSINVLAYEEILPQVRIISVHQISSPALLP